MATNTTKIPYVEGSAPATPATGEVVTYAKADGLMYSKDDAGTETLMSGGAGGGSVATDAIWDAAGDLVQGTGANTAAKLSAGTAGQFLMSAGAAAANLWASRELDYVQFTSSVNVTATVEASANTIVTANAVAFDGSTIALIEFVCADVQSPAGAADVWVQMILFDGTTPLGVMGFVINQVSGHANRVPVHLQYRLTPSNASHTYSIRGIVSAGTAVMNAGAGGTGTRMPGYIRISRAV